MARTRLSSRSVKIGSGKRPSLPVKSSGNKYRTASASRVAEYMGAHKDMASKSIRTAARSMVGSKSRANIAFSAAQGAKTTVKGNEMAKKSRNSKPRVAVVNGKLEPRNTAAKRQQLTQQYAAAGQVISKQQISRQARISMGGSGG